MYIIIIDIGIFIYINNCNIINIKRVNSRWTEHAAIAEQIFFTTNKSSTEENRTLFNNKTKGNEMLQGLWRLMEI